MKDKTPALKMIVVCPLFGLLVALTACATHVSGSGGGGGDSGRSYDGGWADGGWTAPCTSPAIPSDYKSMAKSADHVLLAWNDLGMHCLNPSYDSAVILPPYNTVWAQVVR
ncbi:MAG: hypothetical protein WC889_16420, partial [Myxococcota bacterium]